MWLSNRSMPLLEESAESFGQLAGYLEISARSASLDGATLSGARVSPSLFPLLASRPQLGRLFTEEEAREGADGVVLLSHGMWTTRFGPDADIVGTLVDLDGEPHAVVGVLPEGFGFPESGQRVLDAFGHPAVRTAERGRLGGAAHGRLAHVRRARTTSPRRLAGASGHGGAHLPAGERGRHHGAGGRGPGFRGRARGRCPRGAAVGGDGRRVPARAAGAGRGHGARPVGRVHQRGRAASRARRDAPTHVRPVRGARRGPRPARAAAPDRERGVGPDRGHTRLGRGGRRPARGRRSCRSTSRDSTRWASAR